MSTFLVYKVKKCLLKSGKVTCDAKELPPRRCPIYPKALGIFAQHPEAFPPIVPGTVPHSVGHDSSLRRARFLIITGNIQKAYIVVVV